MAGRPEGGDQRHGGETQHDHQPHPAGLQPGPVDRPGRRGLLHRHLDLRVVSRRADPSLARPRQLDAGAPAAGAEKSARHARQSRQLRHLGAVPLLCRRPVLAGLHRRQALRRQFQGRPQLHRHRAVDRGGMVRSGLCELVRFRSVVVSRRRRPQMVPQHAMEPPDGELRWLAEASCLRRHPAAGVGPSKPPACRAGQEHLSRQFSRPGRGAASVQEKRLLLPDHRRRRHRLRSRRDHGAGAQHRRPLRDASDHPSHHRQGPSGGGVAARGPRAICRDAGGGGLSHPSVRSAAEAQTPLAARPRDSPAEMRLARRRLALSRRRRCCPRRHRSAAEAGGAHRACIDRAPGLR